MPAPMSSAGPGTGGGGPQWTTLATVDFSSAGAADWTGNGTFAVDGVDHDVTNGNKCSSLGPDGSTGLVWVQTSTGVYPTSSPPIVSVDLADFSAIEDGGEIAIDVRYTMGAAPGNNARLSGALYSSNTRLAACGPRYQSSPGAWEYGAFTAGNKFSDYGTALATTTDAVMTFIFSTKGLRWWDRGAFGSGYPDAPGAADLDDAVGVDIGSGESSIIPAISSALFQLSTQRNSGTTTLTVAGYRLRYRSPS